jgi:predicted nucleic acid-binding protein
MTARPYVSGEFCDTNILVYALDTSAEQRKRDVARTLLERLARSETGVLSMQVLQEFSFTITRKIPQPLSWQAARTIVADLTALRIIVPEPADVIAAIDGAQRWQISFWDAMLLVTALKGNVDVVWSEDLDDGQTYDGLEVRNPFAGGR